MRQGWVLYELCLLLPLERVIGMELWVCGTNLWPSHLQGWIRRYSLDPHEFKVIHVNKLEEP